MKLGILFLLGAALTCANQGSFTNSGGTTSGGTVVTSNVAIPPGILNISGNSIRFLSTDGSIAINGTFTSESSIEGCSGGGRGGHISCGYSLTGTFTGTLSLNGATEAIAGTTSQSFGVGQAASGTTSYNSLYTPVYFSDSQQIFRSDDINGTNLLSYGAGQFYGANGIALDSAGRIYIADTYNSRIVRIDDMKGTNFIAYGGSYGSGLGAFNNPTGIAVDSGGKIYILDSGNNQIVRVDDMTGTNRVAYGSAGTGVGQFASYLTSLAVDSSSRIYVADTGNKRIVRFDNMTGANWTALSAFSSPVAVTVDAAGKMYVADDETFQPAVVRVDDMTGANLKSMFLGSGVSPHSIAVDSSGAVYTGGYGIQITDNLAAVVHSTSNIICPIGCYYIFGLTPIPLPTPRPSAISFTPPAISFSQNVGATGTATVTIANFGGSPLDFFAFRSMADLARPTIARRCCWLDPVARRTSPSSPRHRAP